MIKLCRCQPTRLTWSAPPSGNFLARYPPSYVVGWTFYLFTKFPLRNTLLVRYFKVTTIFSSGFWKASPQSYCFNATIFRRNCRSAMTTPFLWSTCSGAIGWYLLPFFALRVYQGEKEENDANFNYPEHNCPNAAQSREDQGKMTFELCIGNWTKYSKNWF